MSLAPPLDKLSLLQVRAEMLALSRQFFLERGILEVDCPILNKATNIDDHIDPLSLLYKRTRKGFLHTSPELFLKKLLAKGASDLYFLGHVFRDHEEGDHHEVEFTLVEWYRKNLSYEGMIQETIDYISLFVEPKDQKTFSYHEALLNQTGIDAADATKEDLLSFIHQKIDRELNFPLESKSDLLSFIFAHSVEPSFKEEELVIIKGYPKEQAALAKTEMEGKVEVARRFEIYYKGIELANGYDELIGHTELLERQKALNEKRVLFGKDPLPIDLDFIEQNAKLPDCRGVAVGFDRLMMLKTKCLRIQESMALID